MNSKQRVLVTGGAGYIGSHTCKMLVGLGHEVLVYDNLSTGHREFVKWGALVEADICDEAALTKTFAEFKPEAVIHFAALATLPGSVAEPLKCYHDNVAGVIALLNAMQAHGCKHLVFSSSCSVYGPPGEDGFLSEAIAYGPSTPYAASKMMAERILFDVEAKTGLKSVMLRYFNAAGADPDGEVGELHEPETHALPLAIASALGKGTFRIFGTDYPTPDGTAIRDYIHVTDLADAHVRALTYLAQGGVTCALNVGTGSGVSVRELLQAVERVSGRKVDAQEAPRREGDPVQLVANSQRAQSVLGWKPNYSDIETIVKTALNWHRQH